VGDPLEPQREALARVESNDSVSHVLEPRAPPRHDAPSQTPGSGVDPDSDHGFDS
jgi:hypothetical protein